MESSDIQSLVALHTAFWNRALPQPIINLDCNFAARYQHVPALPSQWANWDGVLLEPQMLSPEEYQPAPALINEENPLVGEVAFNTLIPYFRVPWLVGIMGAGLRVSTSSQTVWPVPYLDDHWYELPNQGFAPRLEWLDKLLEFVRHNVRRYYPSHCVPTLDSVARSPGDLVPAIMGRERFYYAMYDYPEQLERLLDQITDLYICWARSQLELIPRIHGGYCNQYGIWSAATFIRSQEDYAINLSARLFEDFIMPTTRRVAAAFEYEVFHTHSAFPALAEWALELDDLRVIEVVLDPKGPSLEESLSLWNRILTQKCLMILGLVTQRQLDLLVSELSPGGLWLDVDVVPEGQEEDFTWLLPEP